MMKKLPICQALLSFFLDRAKILLEKHELSNLDIVFNNRTKIVGLCTHKGDMIKISVKIIKFDFNKAIRVFKHEIAHAIDIKRRGKSAHDKVFKKICERIGGDTSRRFHDLEYSKMYYKYIYTCLKCGHVGYRNVSKISSCGKCDKVFNEKYVMEVTINEKMIK